MIAVSEQNRPTVRTYAELDRHARRIASWLQRRTGPGDRVLLMYPSGPEFPTAFFGCLYAGAVAVPCPLPGTFRHQRRRLAGIARDGRASVVLTDDSALPAVERWAAEEGLTDVVCHATDVDGGDPAAWTAPPTTARTLALLQYTSGSTGDPKGVMVTHGNLLANMDDVVTVLGLDGAHRFGGWLPLHHDLGLIGMMLPGILRGGGFVHMDPISFVRRPHRWLAMLDEHDVRATASPDFGYDLCRRRVTDDQLAQLDLSRVVAAVNGAEPVRSDTVDGFCARFSAAGFRAEAMVPMYGLAEATLMVTGTPRPRPRQTAVDVDALEHGRLRPADGQARARRVVACGAPRSFEIAIVDPDTRRVLPDGETGEIWLRGPCTAAGYWRKPEATDELFGARTADGQGPFLRTGDLGGRLDGDLYVTGRRKDVMVVHGRNLHPDDVERTLRAEHAELAALHGAVFSVGDHDGAESVVVVHEIRAGRGPERLRDVATAMKHTVSREFGVAPAAVLLVRPGSVRRTTSGKLQRSEMRRLYLEGALEPVVAAEVIR